MATITGSAKGSQPSIQDTTLRVVIRIWPWLFLLSMIIFFSFQGTGFLTVRNFSNVLVSATLIMLMSLGQTFVIITAGIDLSIGWTVGLSSVITATVMRDLSSSGMEPITAIAFGVLGGLLVSLVPGIINGLLVAKVKIPPFIATIGMFGIVRGAAFLLTDGKNVVGDIPSNVRDVLRAIGNGSLIYRIPGQGVSWLEQPADLPREQLRVLERLLPYPVLIVAIVVIIFAFILARTQFGRHTYAIGGNEEAARRAGINVDRHLIYIYVIAAFCAGIAGVLHVFRFTAGAPNIGEPNLLDSVAAVVIGGTSLFGGEGRISGTVVGVLIIAIVENGLTIMAVDALWKFIIVGSIIILAVIVNQLKDYIERRQVQHG